jgi:predicted FMN-binding regulatory protein PaiB
LEGKWKLGQNRPPYLRSRAIDVLRELPGENERATAELMNAEMEGNGGG